MTKQIDVDNLSSEILKYDAVGNYHFLGLHSDLSDMSSDSFSRAFNNLDSGILRTNLRLVLKDTVMNDIRSLPVFDQYKPDITLEFNYHNMPVGFDELSAEVFYKAKPSAPLKSFIYNNVFVENQLKTSLTDTKPHVHVNIHFNLSSDTLRL